MNTTDPILARAFGGANDTEQAGLINSMSRQLYQQCKGRIGFTMQCCMLADKLNVDGMDLINELAEYVKLRKEKIQP
jgi:hypothetical protein